MSRRKPGKKARKREKRAAAQNGRGINEHRQEVARQSGARRRSKQHE